MTTAPRILICGVNWLGDAVMSLPALQALRDHQSGAHLALLTKPGLSAIWSMFTTIDQVISRPHAGQSLKPTIRELKKQEFEVSYILPHSFRSALPPFLARIPKRIGLPGHFPRDFLLTDVRRPAFGPGREHQVYEYLDLFFPGENRRTFVPPRLTPPPAALDAMRAKLAALPRPWIAMLPGAARGTSKQWPAERYADTAAALVARTGGSVVVLGTAGERAVCQQVAAAAAPNGLNLAGATTLPELAAALALSAAVLCNDSGGMHLAAAVGTPLVALFGITDPARTGPLGERIRLLQHSERRSRDVPRTSAAAQAALRAISVAEAVAAVADLLPPA